MPLISEIYNNAIHCSVHLMSLHAWVVPANKHEYITYNFRLHSDTSHFNICSVNLSAKIVVTKLLHWYDRHNYFLGENFGNGKFRINTDRIHRGISLICEEMLAIPTEILQQQSHCGNMNELNRHLLQETYALLFHNNNLTSTCLHTSLE